MFSWEIEDGAMIEQCPFALELTDIKRYALQDDASVRRPAIARITELVPHIESCRQCKQEFDRIKLGDVEIRFADMSGKEKAIFALKVTALGTLSLAAMLGIAMMREMGKVNRRY